MNLYKDIPHLLAPVIHEPEKCISALKWAVAEMERRLKAFAAVGKRNIGEYNQLKKEEGMPYVIIVVDELADLMMVAGRIAFTTISQIDSRTIIDQAGAEKLLGRGDMLYSIPEYPKPKRIQGALITYAETNKICDFIRAQRPPTYDDEVVSQPVQLTGKGAIISAAESGDSDSAWKEAVEVIINSNKASTSLLQRKLRIGYGRASRLIDMMEDQGIVGPAEGSRPRQVLVSSIDQVFGSAETSDNTSGDVYDDMPEDKNV